MATMASKPQPGDDNDPRSLQELAVDVVQDIHKLATGLAHAGATPEITNRVESTGALYAQIAKALASGPVGQQSVSGQPASPGGAPAPGGPASAPPGPPQPQAAPGPPPGPPQNRINGNSPQGAGYGDLHNTIAQMHHDSVNAVTRSGK